MLHFLFIFFHRRIFVYIIRSPAFLCDSGFELQCRPFKTRNCGNCANFSPRKKQNRKEIDFETKNRIVKICCQFAKYTAANSHKLQDGIQQQLTIQENPRKINDQQTSKQRRKKSFFLLYWRRINNHHGEASSEFPVQLEKEEELRRRPRGG